MSTQPQQPTGSTTNPSRDPREVADKDGRFRRQDSKFRNFISSEPGAQFPPEKDRYVLYINYGCPWAHRANIVYHLKRLDSLMQLVVMDHTMGPEGWVYNPDRPGTEPKDPLYGFTKHKDLYLKADPEYTGRFTVPTLWDRKAETIVNNESAEIIRMLYSEFDDFLPKEVREASKADGGLYPESLRGQIDEMNEWVYNDLNNGVYKTGFAQAQDAYEESVTKVFNALDRVARHMAENEGPFIFGKHLTEADIRLYTTIVRFDVGYHTLFRCNLKMIRHDYPNIQKWLLHIYWDLSPDQTRGAFKRTTHFGPIKEGYAGASKSKVVPLGPVPDIAPKP